METRPPLADMADLAAEFGALLVVDDAHGIGVLGARGGGVVEQQGLDGALVPVLVGTLGKAFGCSGAFIAGSEEIIEHIVNEARSYIYTTAMPPALATAARTALRLVREEGWRRDKLRAHIEQVRAEAHERGIDLGESQTPIQPLLIGASQAALDLSRALSTEGFLVTAIRPPTVPDGTARLRITLSAEHQPDQVTGLLEAIRLCQRSR